MSDIVSFAEISSQHVELLPGRTMLTAGAPGVPSTAGDTTAAANIDVRDDGGDDGGVDTIDGSVDLALLNGIDDNGVGLEDGGVDGNDGNDDDGPGGDIDDGGVDGSGGVDDDGDEDGDGVF